MNSGQSICDGDVETLLTAKKEDLKKHTKFRQNKLFRNTPMDYIEYKVEVQHPTSSSPYRFFSKLL